MTHPITRLLVASGVALAAAPAAAAPDPAVFFDEPALAEVTLSPSGGQIAMLRREPGGLNALQVLALAEGRVQGARTLAAYGDVDIAAVNWVGDEYLVYSLLDPRPGHDWRSWMAPGLFSVPAAGGPPRTLVKLGVEFPVRVDPDRDTDRRLPSNHQLLTVPADGSGEVIVGRLQFAATGHPASSTPLRLRVSDGQTRAVDTGGVPEAERWFFDSQGRARATRAYRDGQVSVQWRDLAGGAWRLLATHPALEQPWWLRAVADDGRLLVDVPRGAAGERELAWLDPARTPLEPVGLLATPGFDIAGGGRWLAQAPGRLAGFWVDAEERSHVWLDPVMQALQAEVDQRLPGRSNHIDCRRCGEADRVVLIRSASDRDPGTWLLWQGRGGRPQVVGREHPAVETARMAPLRLERLRARDGRDLPVWITQPARAAGSPPPPAVVLVHGGPWIRGVHWEWEPTRQFLAAHGWVVIEPEFRGSRGYGEAHYRAGWKQVGQGIQDDIADATRWAIGAGHVDPRRVCLMGTSHGGYATLMGLVRDPGLFRCGVAMAAVTEPLRWLEGSWWWRDDIDADARRHLLPQLLGDAKADAALFEAISPLRQAERIRAPVLLVHGERDRRVPPIHAQQMRDALRRHGNPPEWLLFPDEGHGWAQIANQRLLATRVADFLTRQFGSDAAPAAAAPARPTP